MRELDARLPLEVPVSVGGERGPAEAFESTDPGQPDRVVATRGREQRGGRCCGGRGGRARLSRLGARAPPPSVPRCFARPPQILRERRLELAALQVRECAKPWPEADGDVCEAIDFLEYYAHDAVELDEGRRLVQVPGERNTMRYAPRGVAAVIAPGTSRSRSRAA